MFSRPTLLTFLALLGACACGESPSDPAGLGAGAGGSSGRAGSDGSGVSGNGAGGGGAGAGGSGALPDAEPDFSVPASAIRVTTWLSLGETELVAFFADVPALRFHQESERIGQCRLMTYEPSTCTPACSGTEACIDARCESHPVRVDGGPIEWQWPGGQQTVTASPEILSYHAIGAATSRGDVTVRARGVTLSAPNDEAPAPDGDWAAAISARGSGDVTLRWTNATAGARIRVHMTDCNGSHGGFAEAEIECEGPDSGVLVLPGAFLDRLDAGSWSRGECGSHTFARYRAVSADDESFRFETVARGDFFYRP